MPKKDQSKVKSKQKLSNSRKRSVKAQTNDSKLHNAKKVESEAHKLDLDSIYSKLDQACSRSTHMQGKLKGQNSRLIVELPDALPSMLLLRALRKDDRSYQALSAERLAEDEQQSTQLQLNVAGLSEQQLEAFIVELDELIGEFTARG